MATRTSKPTQPWRNQEASRHAPVSGLGSDNGPVGLMRASLGFQEISLNIPEDAKLVDILQTLSLAVQGYKRLSEASEQLKPIIGRILLTVQTRKLFKPEYKNFTAFVMEKVCGDMGLGRSNAFDSLRIARAFPTMSVDDYKKFGASRLLLASQVTSEDEPDYKDVLINASRQTVDEFALALKTAKANTQRTVTTTVSIRVAPEVKGEWQALLEASDNTPGELFGAMLEAYSRTAKRNKQVTH